jgi:HSP20 family protein
MTELYRIRLQGLERELVSVAWQLSRLQWRCVGPPLRWTPAWNAYRCADRFVVCVDLAGVATDSLSVHVDPRRLVVKGRRPPPGPPCGPDTPAQIIAMEIDYGPFERELNWPQDVDADRVSIDYTDGLLWIVAPFRGQT